jgi:hypothetical protein
MLVPALLELVRVKDSHEIFRVLAFNLAAHTADLIRPGRNTIEHGVPWVMLEAVGDDGASWLLAGEPARQGLFPAVLTVSFELSR